MTVQGMLACLCEVCLVVFTDGVMVLAVSHKVQIRRFALGLWPHCAIITQNVEHK